MRLFWVEDELQSKFQRAKTSEYSEHVCFRRTFNTNRLRRKLMEEDICIN